VFHADDEYDQSLRLDFVNHPINTVPDAKQLLFFQLFQVRRAGIGCQLLNLSQNSGCILLRNFPKILPDIRRKLNLARCLQRSVSPGEWRISRSRKTLEEVSMRIVNFEIIAGGHWDAVGKDNEIHAAGIFG
jgi:hypothetical protein